MLAMGKDTDRHMEEIENSLTLDCVIGIEDELQDEVPQVIKQILEAGIKFVVISGDKS
jgi:P-type E1-E2 ATPase